MALGRGGRLLAVFLAALWTHAALSSFARSFAILASWGRNSEQRQEKSQDVPGLNQDWDEDTSYLDQDEDREAEIYRRDAFRDRNAPREPNFETHLGRAAKTGYYPGILQTRKSRKPNRDSGAEPFDEHDYFDTAEEVRDHRSITGQSRPMGYFLRRDLDRIRIGDVDPKGWLRRLSIDELEQRINSKMGLESRVSMLRKPLHRLIETEEGFLRPADGPRVGQNVPLPPTAIKVLQETMANRTAAADREAEEQERKRKMKAAFGNAKNLNEWLVAAPVRVKDNMLKEEKDMQDMQKDIAALQTPGAVVGKSRYGGSSKNAKMIKAVMRSPQPLPWDSVAGNESWASPCNQTWEELGLSGRNGELLVSKLIEFGIDRPNRLQAQALPEVLKGSDVFLTAATGCGKTLGFLLPLLQKYVLPVTAEQVEVSRAEAMSAFGRTDKKIYARPKLIVVAPNRELASQSHQIVKDLLAPWPHLHSVLLVGGAVLKTQDEHLKDKLPMVVIGTPGRMMDHVTSGRLKLIDLDAVVLDEVDAILEVSRTDHIQLLMRSAFEHFRAQRVIVSASGLISNSSVAFAEERLRRPWRAIGPASTIDLPPNVLHLVNPAPDVEKKIGFIRRLYNSHPAPDGIIIFVNSVSRAEKLCKFLYSNGIPVKTLHGNRTSANRMSAIDDMVSGKIDVLIATDVSARGIDFRFISHVVNFDIPESAVVYAHRAGRVGRNGFRGVVITLGPGGAMNLRMNRYKKELGSRFTLHEANVADGLLGVSTHL